MNKQLNTRYFVGIEYRNVDFYFTGRHDIYLNCTIDCFDSYTQSYNSYSNVHNAACNLDTFVKDKKNKISELKIKGYDPIRVKAKDLKVKVIEIEYEVTNSNELKRKNK